jgi:FSR family fosmidomycin resistance protein-like MFS transporter
LTYVQIGWMLTAPALVANLVEPAIGILGDVWKRRALVVGGGVAFTLALGLVAGSAAFVPLLLAWVVMYPASGAFVSLSQATLMDLAPERHEHNMARWTLAGSVGVVAGPLAIGAGTALGAGWHAIFAACAALSFLIVALVWRRPFPATHPESAHQGFRTGVRNALGALRRREVLRWLILLECSDLLLDVFLGFVALYFRDVVKTTPATAGLSVAVWTATGLAGNVLLLRLLERVAGLRYLWISTALTLILFPAFLLAPGAAPKLALLGVLGLTTAGWYPVLQGRLYSAMPGQSGTVMSVGNLFGAGRALIPLAIAAVAERFTLGAAMWLLLLGPLALLVGLPSASWRAVAE